MAASQADVRLGQIGQIAVNVHDVDAAVEFYRDKLGMQFLFQVPNMAFFDCDGVRLMLGVPEKPEFDRATDAGRSREARVRPSELDHLLQGG
jgi:catechol 2,3-dioxygenase-like lactoylglutathione lyase family enzyme